MAASDRLGKLENLAATSSWNLALARTDQPYRKQRIPVLLETRNNDGFEGTEESLLTRSWRVTSWETDLRYKWEPGVGWFTLGAFPDFDGNLRGPLGHAVSDSDDTNHGLWTAGGAVWRAYKPAGNYEVTRLTTSMVAWDTAQSIGSTSRPRSATYVTDATNGGLWLGLEDGSIRQLDWDGAANAELTPAASLDSNYVPLLAEHQGSVFAVVGVDLYQIPVDDPGTPVLVSDVTSRMSDLMDDDNSGTRVKMSWNHKRVASTDVGVAWMFQSDQGDVEVWEYNVAADTSALVARLPSIHAVPGSLTWAFGYFFVGYQASSVRDASSGANTVDYGTWYIYYQGRGLSGVIGPLFWETDEPGYGSGYFILDLIGFYGSELFFFRGAALMSYDLDQGRLRHLLNGAPDPQNARDPVFSTMMSNKQMWIEPDTDSVYYAAVTGSAQAAHTAGYRSGWFDFDAPGQTKLFLDITVDYEADDGQDISIRYKVDGGSETSNLIDASTGTSATYTINETGDRIEFRVLPYSDNTDFDIDITRVKAVTIRATSGNHRPRWILEVDMGALVGSYSGYTPRPQDVLNDLDSLRGQLLTFTDPWQVGEDDAYETHTVVVQSVETPEVDNADAFATLVLVGKDAG